MTDPLLFLLAGLTLLATPGPTNTLLATAGASAGLRASLHLLLAELLGYAVAIAVIWAVLGPVTQTIPELGTALKLVVGAYVAWLAIKLWMQPVRSAAPLRIDFRMVSVTTLLNPKALVFALGVLPTGHPQLLAYAVGFGACVLVAGGSWIGLGSALRAASGSGRSWLLQRAAAVALGGFAGMLLASTLTQAGL